MSFTFVRMLGAANNRKMELVIHSKDVFFFFHILIGSWLQDRKFKEVIKNPIFFPLSALLFSE